jgi:MFS superfamily sulfate permease-like transporter
MNVHQWTNDLKASFVVFLVAIPLCLGISLASGAPLLSGVIAGIIGGIIVGFLSNSQTSVSGPAAGLAVIVLDAITKLQDFYLFTLAVFLAGIFQICFGLLKGGNLGSYFPNSVIKGMLAAIGIVVILKQFPHAIGYDHEYMGGLSFFDILNEGNTFLDIVLGFKFLSLGAVLISILSIFSMVYWEKLAKKGYIFFKIIPGALFAVILGISFNELVFPYFDNLVLSKDHLVNLPIQAGLYEFTQAFMMPNWDGLTNPVIYQVAITLAIVASIETLLSIEAIDKVDEFKRTTDKNKELIAQGIGNSLSGLVGGLPITSVIVRSSANVNSGSATKLSAILHGCWLLLAIVLIPRYLELIPLASLASILILVGYKLCHPSLFKRTYGLGNGQFIPFMVTILAIVFTDLLTGICIGLITGFAFILKSNSMKAIVVASEGNDYLVRFMKDVSFLQKPRMTDILDSIPNDSTVIIDGSNHVHIDQDIIAIIEEFESVSKKRNIKCEIIKSSLAMNAFFKG